MNIHTRKLMSDISESEVHEALSVLQKWRDQGGDLNFSSTDLASPAVTSLWTQYPKLTDKYQTDFKLDGDYKESLPDLQNGPSSLIRGENRQIQHVGISNFRLPINFQMRDGGNQTLQTSVTGTVSLEADKKGKEGRAQRMCLEL